MIIQDVCNSLPVLPGILYELFTTEDVISETVTENGSDLDTHLSKHTPNTPYWSYMEVAQKWCETHNQPYSRLLSYIKDVAIDVNPLALKDTLNMDYYLAGLLEQHDPSYVYTYCENIVYAFANYRAGATCYAVSYDTNTRSSVDSETRDKTWRETDDIVDSNFTHVDYESIRVRLPALMLSVHRKMKTFNLLGMSVVRAMYLSQKPVYKAGDLLQYGIYTLRKRTGEYVKIETGLNAISNGVIPWINGNDRDLSYRDLIELLQLLHIADINMQDLDPLKFDDSYFENLTVAYITSNSELLARVENSKKRANKPYSEVILNQALKSVSSISISSYLSGNTYIEDYTDNIKNTCNFLNKHAINSEYINYEAYYTLISTFKFNTSNNVFENGILCSKVGVPVMINITGAFNRANTQVKFAVYHQDGTLGIVDSNTQLFYITSAAKYKQYLEMPIQNRNDTWGVWDVCRL